MGGEVYTNGRRWGSQASRSTVSEPADPVFLRNQAPPGVSPYLATSAQIKTPASSIRDNGTQIATEHSAYPKAQHLNPLTVAGAKSLAPKDSPTTFLSNYAPKVFLEGARFVVHLTQAMTTSIHQAVMASVQLKNMAATMEHMNAATARKVGLESFDQLKESLTLEALGGVLLDVALGLGGAALVATGIGAGAGAAMEAKAAVSTVQRGTATVEQAAEVGRQGKQLLAELSNPNMNPQAMAERLMRFLASSAGALLIALITKKAASFKKQNKPQDNLSKQAPSSSASTPCACATKSPVILATGEKTLNQTDFTLDGAIPIAWHRRYRSGDSRSDGWFGQGWSHPLATELRLQADGLLYFDAQGRAVPLPWIEAGETHFDAYEQLTLARPGEHHWELRFNHGQTHHFPRFAHGQWRLALACITDRNLNRLELVFDNADFGARFDAFATPPRPHRIEQPGLPPLHLRWTADGLLGAAEIHFHEPGSLTPVSRPLARYHYAPDPAGGLPNLIRHTNPLNQARSFEWCRHLLVGYTLASGHRHRNVYDQPQEQLGPAARVLLSESLDDGIHDRFAYQGDITWVRDALGHTTAYRHDAREDIVAVRDALGQVSETPFDANGHPKGAIDPLGRQHTTLFDRRGNLTQLIDAAGNQTRIDYNDLDLPIHLTDALGGTWSREYDPRGNLVASTDPLGRTTRYELDERGRITAIVDALGKRKHLEWSPAGFLSAYTDCSGHITRFRYSLLGHLQETIDALGQRTLYRFDPLGRLEALRGPDDAEHRYRWDGEGNLIEYTDPLGQTTRWRYTRVGDPLERIDALGQRLTYTYDAAGRLVRLTNENGQHTHFRYDAIDRLTDEIGFDGRHQRYVYNPAGELTHLVERGGSTFGPGKLTRYERDVLGRLTAKRHEGTALPVDSDEGFQPWTLPFEQAVKRAESYAPAPGDAAHSRFAYDKLGRLIEAGNALASVRFAYDPVGNLLGETQTLTLPGQTLRTFGFTHVYDALDNRTQTRLPNGKVLEQLFYGSGHLHQITLDGQFVSDFERDALHREIQRSQGRLTSRFDYDPVGRLTAQRVARTEEPTGSPSTRPALIERRYGYDRAGQLTDLLDRHRGHRRYAYDPIGRITASRLDSRHGLQSAPHETFHWDPASNPVPEPFMGRHGLALPDNRLTVWQDTRYTYDTHGNLVERIQGKRDSHAQTRTRFTWDDAHQLRTAEVTRGSSERAMTQTFEYAYDALGRRIAKTDTFGTTLFLWDGDQMVLEQRGGNETHTLYHPGAFVPLAQIHNGQLHHLHTDHLGTPLEASNDAGDITWRVTYKTWGNVLLKEEEQITQNLRFQGQYFDQETGLHYNRFRYYDPGPGRFVSQDPIGLLGG